LLGLLQILFFLAVFLGEVLFSVFFSFFQFCFVAAESKNKKKKRKTKGGGD